MDGATIISEIPLPYGAFIMMKKQADGVIVFMPSLTRANQ
jgi:hypothetical protein